MSKVKKYTILKWCHYSNFIPSITFIDEVMTFERKITFDQSCSYDINEASCVNKLFGFCFGFGVHQDSVRFGWTYDKTDKTIHIWSYVYCNGKLSKHDIKKIELGSLIHTALYDYKIKLQRLRSDNPNCRNKYVYQLFIDDVLLYGGDIYSNKLLSTTLGFYFGGNTRAPHKMIIKELKN